MLGLGEDMVLPGVDVPPRVDFGGVVNETPGAGVVGREVLRECLIGGAAPGIDYQCFRIGHQQTGQVEKE